MSALQTAIAGLQTAETALVQAVKSYNGSVAGKANESMRNALASEKTIKSKVETLRNQIEGDGQSLILDWEYDVAIVNGEARRMSEVVDFTRSTGGGRIGPDGKYEWVGADVPRITYDPVTGECLGLLVEEQRTNKILRSQDFSNVYWTKAGDAVVSASQFAAPDGSMTAQKITGSSAGLGHVVRDANIAASGNTKSIYIRSTSGSGTIGTLINASTRLITITDEWVRLDYPGGDVHPNPYFYVCDFRGATLTEVHVWGAQVEQGTFPTSYIPTAGSAVTRAADEAKRLLGSEFNNVEGTVFGEIEVEGISSTFSVIFALNAGSIYPIRMRKLLNSGAYQAQYGLLTTADIAPIVIGQKVKYALSYGPGFVRGAINGVVRSAAGETEPLTTGDISLFGAGSEKPIAAEHKNLEYIPRALSEAELQELTA